ncbi:MAG: glycosyltransferase family 4 protein [Acidobacteriota bacterium]
MRLLQLVAGEKWTGAAAVVYDQTAALVASGFEAQFGFVRDSPLSRRLLPLGWARPLLSRPRWPLDYARDLRHLRETLEREKFDAVHCHLSHDHFLAAAAVRGTGIPLARTFHNLAHVRNDFVSRGLVRRTAAFAFANRAIAAKFDRAGPVLSPVVDSGRFRPGALPRERLESLGVPAGAFIVGTVGKMAAGRGHAEAIAAVAALPAPAVMLHVGKGELRPTLETQAGELGAGARNFWAGYEEDGLPELYRAMDVLLFTASGSEQGQRAILEAMSSGVPVVALDLPGVPDLLTHGREGLVVRQPTDLVAALTRLRDSADERSGMAGRARERALEFGPDRFAARAREFYAGLPVRNSSTSRAWDAGETAG